MEEPSMRAFSFRPFAVSLLACLVLGAIAGAAAPPVPPVKFGLWEARMSTLDSNGRETVPPEQAAMARMPPEARARMAEAMKARGLSMPDSGGATKVCLTKEVFEAGGWQQLA